MKQRINRYHRVNRPSRCDVLEPLAYDVEFGPVGQCVVEVAEATCTEDDGGEAEACAAEFVLCVEFFHHAHPCKKRFQVSGRYITLNSYGTANTFFCLLKKPLFMEIMLRISGFFTFFQEFQQVFTGLKYYLYGKDYILREGFLSNTVEKRIFRF